jgi:hypothetical protein
MSRLAAVLALVTACHGSSPCAIDVLVADPSAGTGGVIHAARIPSAAFGIVGSAALCASCSTLISVADGATFATFDLGPRTNIGGVTATSNAVYAIGYEAPPPPPSGDDDDDGPTGSNTNLTLFALHSDGGSAWSMPLNRIDGLVADATGPTLIDGGSAFALASDGSTRWSAVLPPANVTVADGSGGLYRALGSGADATVPVAGALAHVDATGAVVASVQLSTTNSSSMNYGSFITPTAMDATSDGGVVLAGWVEGDYLGLGSAEIATGSNEGTSPFVVAFDGSGNVDWAHVFDPEDPVFYSIASIGDLVVVSGAFQGTLTDLPLAPAQSSDVAVISLGSDGVHTVIQLGGTGTQDVSHLFAATPTSVWVDVDNNNGYNGEPSVLTVGSTTFSDGGLSRYVLELGL